jgi:hypothetical protein
MTRAPRAAKLLNNPLAPQFNGPCHILMMAPGSLFAAIIRHRLAHELYGSARFATRIVAEIAHALAGVDIHPGAKIQSAKASNRYADSPEAFDVPGQRFSQPMRANTQEFLLPPGRTLPSRDGVVGADRPGYRLQTPRGRSP